MKYDTQSVLGHMNAYFTNNPGIQHEGRKWVKHTMREISENTGVPINSIKHMMLKFEADGKLERRNLNSDKRDRGLWFSLTDSK